MKIFKSGKSTVLRSLATPHLLTSPLPRHLPKFRPSGAWDQGKPRWRLMMAVMAPLFNFKLNQGMGKDSARTRIGLSVQWFSSLWII